VRDLAFAGGDGARGDQTFGATKLGGDGFGIASDVRYRLLHPGRILEQRGVQKAERVDAGVGGEPHQIGGEGVALAFGLG